MPPDRFTKQQADETSEALDELFEAIPKPKRNDYLGHLNDIALFIAAAKRAAPDKPLKKQA
jgi:hypothetical protein